jgi:preprotein translocase subunit SecF
MPHFFKQTNINFISIRWICISISAIIILSGIVTLLIRGQYWSIDFTGGLEIQVQFDRTVSDGEVRSALTGVDVGEVKSISGIGKLPEILIRVKSGVNAEETQKMVTSKLNQAFPNNAHTIRSVQVVGPKVGKELRAQAGLSALLTIILLLIYISWRFEFVYAVGGILSLLHDTLLTLAFLAFFGYEFSLTVLAAILTLLGFSINDTIVVYDRIRENIGKLRSMDLGTLMNLSINETLSRTVITSLTVFLTTLVLFIFGGPVLRGFSFTMGIGIITGTYSSIYVAAPIVLEWSKKSVIKGKKR